jgi:parallel beta-helix repeat protein
MQARATVVALASAGALAFCASPAFAHGGPTTVHCGQTLTHSVKLANDLTDCPSNGLIIGADGITVDLNGHTIDGTVTQTSCDFPADPRAGINNLDGHDRLTIADGSIRQFDMGLDAGGFTTGMSDSRLHDLTLRDNRFGGVGFGSGADPSATADNAIDHNVVTGSACGSGVNLNTGRGNRFAHNRILDTHDGIFVGFGESTDGNIIADNSVSNIAGIGIWVVKSGAARVERNDLTDIGSGDDGCLPLNTCIGIDIGGDSSNTVVEDNTITRARNAGIEVDTSFDFGATQAMTDVRVSGNTLTSTGDGIWLIDTDHDVVTRNTVTAAGSFGSPSAFGLAVLLNGASDTQVSRNTITDGGRGIAPGILIGLPPDFGPSPRPVNGNVVVRNTVNRQQADGILVEPVAENTTLERNTANGNANDGIRVLSALTTITRNTADNNGAYGIDAIPGATDGGHNQASGNGGPAQCTGIACS